MNRAEELRHYIADVQATIAITTGDLAGEVAAASNGKSLAHHLQHLIVTQFTDVIDPSNGSSVIPAQWLAWLTEHHPLPCLTHGDVHHWRDVLQVHDELLIWLVDRDDLALLPYTSGTTGLPKGRMLTHASIMHNAMATSFWLDGTPEMVSLVVLPLFHITGLVCVMHASIFVGGTSMIMLRWDRDVAGRSISQHGVSHWTRIPTMIIDLLASPELEQYDFSGLVYIGGGGSAMPQAVAERCSIGSGCGLSRAMALRSPPPSRCSILVMRRSCSVWHPAHQC